MHHKFTVLDLFSGIGGFSLGLESTGYFETIAFVEKDQFCQKVLAKNFKDIPIEGDIRNVKGQRYEADVVTGGFPCQPFSQAGRKKGTHDDRYLWDETIRVIKECKPRWFIGENVEGIINIQNGMVLRQVQDDLEEQGFEVKCLIIPASGIGAWHQRKRVWIIANSKKLRNGGRSSERCGIEERKFQQKEQKGSEVWSEVKRRSSQNLWHTKSPRLKSSINRQGKKQFRGTNSPGVQCKKTWWEIESELCGVPNGLSYELDKDRVNRIKSLGNSIIPQIAYQIGKAIIYAEDDV